MKINISGNWSLLLFILMILLSRENGLHARLKTPPTLKTTHPTTAHSLYYIYIYIYTY